MVNSRLVVSHDSGSPGPVDVARLRIASASVWEPASQRRSHRLAGTHLREERLRRHSAVTQLASLSEALRLGPDPAVVPPEGQVKA